MVMVNLDWSNQTIQRYYNDCRMAEHQTEAWKLLELSKSEHSEVRRLVACNAHTPLEVLAVLLQDKNDAVRYAVVQNTNTPPEVLVKLSKEDQWYVRRAVAQNTNTPLECYTWLIVDEDEDVRRAAEDELIRRMQNG